MSRVVVQNPDDTLELGTSQDLMEDMELLYELDDTRKRTLEAISMIGEQMHELTLNPTQDDQLYNVSRIQNLQESATELNQQVAVLTAGISRMLRPPQPELDVVEVRTGLNLFRSRRVSRQVLGRTPTERVRI